MADAPDSKSGRGNPVRVQVPPPAPNEVRYLVPLDSGFSGWCVRSLYPNCAQNTLLIALIIIRARDHRLQVLKKHPVRP